MNTSDDREAAARFAEAWDEFLLAIRRSQAQLRAAAGELSLSQYYLLQPLLGERELSASVLAARAGISGPTATRVIDGLEADGHVRRRRSSLDRRSVLVSLAPRGRAALERKRRRLRDRRRRIYARLGPRERRDAERLLRHLAELIGDL